MANQLHELFYDTCRTRWFDTELQERPADAIETPYGMATLKVNQDSTVAIMVDGLHTLWTVTYKISGYFELNPYTEAWMFVSGIVRARLPRENEYAPDGWKMCAYSTPTDKACQRIGETLEPVFEAWVEKNWQQLSEGKRVHYRNLISQARAKIKDIEAQLEQRSKWIDAIEDEFNRTGKIDTSRREYFDFYGSKWSFK